MLSKYTVEYLVEFKKHSQPHHYGTNDPVACEEFLAEILEHGFRITAIRHDGAELQRREADLMIRTAARMLAAKRICASLGIKPEEERFRFGLAA
jgi:hypothetical protein